MCSFEKPSESNPEQNRFGPARQDEVISFIQKHIEPEVELSSQTDFVRIVQI